MTASTPVWLGTPRNASSVALGAKLRLPVVSSAPLVTTRRPPSFTVTAALTTPLPLSVPPLPTVRPPVLPSVPSTSSVPAVICVVPPIALVPVSCSVPVPIFSREPASFNEPANVLLASLTPSCSVLPPRIATLPTPVTLFNAVLLPSESPAAAATSTLAVVPNVPVAEVASTPLCTDTGPLNKLLPDKVNVPRPVLVSAPAPLSTPVNARSSALAMVRLAPRLTLLPRASAIALLKVEVPSTDRLPAPSAVLLPTASVPAFNTLPPT